MGRIKKGRDGKYHVNGKTYKMLVGSRVSVWNGNAYKTSYGKDALKRGDIKKNKWGRLVSKRKSAWGKRRGLKQLRLAGYTTKKGKFGAIKIGSKKRSKGRRKTKRRKKRRTRRRR